jgi:hypothetical protein
MFDGESTSIKHQTPVPMKRHPIKNAKTSPKILTNTDIEILVEV